MLKVLSSVKWGWWLPDSSTELGYRWLKLGDFYGFEPPRLAAKRGKNWVGYDRGTEGSRTEAVAMSLAATCC